MRLTRTQISAGVAAGVVVLAVAWSMRPKAVEVDAAAVTIAPLEATVDGDGKTRVRERFVVVAPVAGRVERILLVQRLTLLALRSFRGIRIRRYDRPFGFRTIRQCGRNFGRWLRSFRT